MTTRKLPSWMQGGDSKKSSNTSAKKRRKTSSPSSSPPPRFSSSQSSQPSLKPKPILKPSAIINPLNDPIQIYQSPPKPPQDSHQKLREFFRETISKQCKKDPKTSPSSPFRSPSPVQHKTPPSAKSIASSSSSSSSTPYHSPYSSYSSGKSTPSPSPPAKNPSPPVKNYTPPSSQKSTPSPNSTRVPLSPLAAIALRSNITPPSISPPDKNTTSKKRKSKFKRSPSLSPSSSPVSPARLSFGNSPLRSPQLSPDSHFPPSPKKVTNILTDLNVKNTLELKDDNDSNYSESEGGGEGDGEKSGGSDGDGSDFEFDENEESEFLFINEMPSTLSPLPSPELSGSEGMENEMKEKRVAKKSTFICDHPCSARTENKNKPLTDALERVQRLHAYNGEQWQEMSIRKAITAIQRYPETITSISQAKKIPGIGAGITTKIIAFLEGNPIATKGPPQLELFSNVWGAGPRSIKHWISKGYTNLEQVLKDPDLTLEQRIGIKYYASFRTRIPRKEVELHVAKVAEVVKQMPSSVNASVMAAGSYRRGREDCGDIDVLVLHPSPRPTGVLQDLVGRLHNIHFLVDDLQLSQVKQRDWGHHFDKYMGVSKVGELARRIDIMVVPAGSHAATLLYMTGSAYFNRSLRLKSKKNGYYLCNHAVARADINGKRVGPPIPVHTEEEIFKLLNTPYQHPTARDW